ncbi:MAG: tetratricopeptide repeat protein [Phycisphaerales bacterium]
MKNFLQNKMKKINKLLILLTFSLLPVAGCIQGQATVSLNSDGSGKIFIETVIDPCTSQSYGDVWQSYRTYLTQIKNTLMQTEGIDSWSEVEWKILPNGKYYFTAKAWFNSINKVAFHLGQFRGNLNAYLEDVNGTKTLSLKSLKSQAEEKAWEKQNSALRYKLFASDMTGILSTLKLDLIFILPSPPENIQSFEKIEENTIHYLVSGKRLSYLLDYISQNGLYQLADRWNYDKVEFLNNELIPLYLEKAGEPNATFKSDKNLFDYAKEISATKKDIVKILENLEADTVKAKLRQQTAKQNIPAQPDSPVPQAENIESQFRYALLLEYKNEYQKAAKVYQQIIDSNHAEGKNLAQAHYRLGICYFEIGDDENALRHFRYVILKYPSERLPALRSSNMIRDIGTGKAIRKSDKNLQGPTIIDSSPTLYTQDINSLSVDRIIITFGKPMDSDNWFYSSFGTGKLPQITGLPTFDETKTIWTLPVKLEKSQVYALAFNTGDGSADKKNKPGFRDLNGNLCKPFVLVFATLDDANEPTDIDVKIIDKSSEINIAN